MHKECILVHHSFFFLQEVCRQIAESLFLRETEGELTGSNKML